MPAELLCGDLILFQGGKIVKRKYAMVLRKIVLFHTGFKARHLTERWLGFRGLTADRHKKTPVLQTFSTGKLVLS